MTASCDTRKTYISQSTPLKDKNLLTRLRSQQDEQLNELLDYRLRVLELETRVRYLEAIEHAARRYVGRINDGRRVNKHKGFKEAKNELINALDLFEALEISAWDESNS